MLKLSPDYWSNFLNNLVPLRAQNTPVKRTSSRPLQPTHTPISKNNRIFGSRLASSNYLKINSILLKQNLILIAAQKDDIWNLRDQSRLLESNNLNQKKNNFLLIFDNYFFFDFQLLFNQN